MGAYEDVFRSSTDDPEGFWLGAARSLDWHVEPTRALDASRPPFYRWFPDGELNVCHNALDRHVDAGRGEQTALVYDSPVTGTQRTYTYEELRDEVARFAGVLSRLGVGHGDRVVIYMPMVPEAAFAMLACAGSARCTRGVFGVLRPRSLPWPRRRPPSVIAPRPFARGPAGERVQALLTGDRDGGAPPSAALSCSARRRAAMVPTLAGPRRWPPHSRFPACP